MTEVVQDLLKLVILRNYIYILFRVLGHLLAGRKREARVAWEQKPVLYVLFGLGAVQHLREDAAKRPHVDTCIVVLLHHDDFRRSVPSGGDVVGQAAILLLSLWSIQY